MMTIAKVTTGSIAVAAIFIMSAVGAHSDTKGDFVSVYKRKVYCTSNQNQPIEAEMHTGHMSNDNPNANFYLWRFKGGNEITFKGSGEANQPFFWFGKLNEKNAAGYTLNRGHWVFETEDTAFLFECWEKGFEHGSY